MDVFMVSRDRKIPKTKSAEWSDIWLFSTIKEHLLD